MTLDQGTVEGRNFPDWSMGFRSVNAADLQKIPGFSSLGDKAFTAPAFTERPPAAILDMMMIFYDATG